MALQRRLHALDLRRRLGDPTADELWSAAKERPAGLTRTEVSDLFSRNKKRREIERALSVLEDAGRLRRETRQPERGRSAEVWIPVLLTDSQDGDGGVTLDGDGIVGNDRTT